MKMVMILFEIIYNLSLLSISYFFITFFAFLIIGGPINCSFTIDTPLPFAKLSFAALTIDLASSYFFCRRVKFMNQIQFFWM